MNKIYRICTQCGKNGPLEADHCPHCGYSRFEVDDTSIDADSGALPARQKSLPATVAKAALPILVGAAGMIARAGWHLLQNRLESAAHQHSVDQNLHPQKIKQSVTPRDSVSQNHTTAVRHPRHTIHIRSQWAVGDGRGEWHHGSSEHTIEIE